MNKLFAWAVKYGKTHFTNYLKENKAEVVAAVNAKLNLPVLGEKAEAELFDALISATIEVIESVDVK